MDAAKAAGLKAVALTDHDTVTGVEAAVRRGVETGIDVIPGVELSAYVGEQEVHILGLYVSTTQDSPISELLDRMRQGRPQRVLKIAEKLRGLGVPLRDQDVLDEVGGSDSPGRAHVAAALVKHGYVKDMQDAFVRFLRPGGPAYVTKLQFSPDEVIKTVHRARGLAVLAHPGQYARDEVLLPVLRGGVDGVEVFHHSQPSPADQYFEQFARKHGRFITGGSDFHGPRLKPGILLGSQGVSAEMYSVIQEKLSEVRRLTGPFPCT